MYRTRTTTSLLDDLVDPSNQEVWEAFDARLRPILLALALRLGLSPQDAADAAQETLTRFVRAYRDGQYDRSRGGLRSWVLGIARHCIIDMQQKRIARRERPVVDDIPDDRQLESWWDAECQLEVLRLGIAELREQTNIETRTITAFERLALDRRTPAAVAQEMHMTLNDVYLAKHRCLKRLRSIVDRLSELYEVGGDGEPPSERGT